MAFCLVLTYLSNVYTKQRSHNFSFFEAIQVLTQWHSIIIIIFVCLDLAESHVYEYFMKFLQKIAIFESSALFSFLAWCTYQSHFWKKNPVSDNWLRKVYEPIVGHLHPTPQGGEISVIFMLFSQNIHQKNYYFRLSQVSWTSQLVGLHVIPFSWHTVISSSISLNCQWKDLLNFTKMVCFSDGVTDGMTDGISDTPHMVDTWYTR